MNINTSENAKATTSNKFSNPISKTSPQPLKTKQINFQVITHDPSKPSLVCKNLKNVVHAPVSTPKLISPEEFIPKLEKCVNGLKKIAYPSQNITGKSEHAPLFSFLPNDCSLQILLYAPPIAACVCKAWQKHHEIAWKELLSDHALKNIAALKKERIQHQISFAEMPNKGQEALNLGFIGKKLLTDSSTCVDETSQPLLFKSEHFEKLPLYEQATLVTNFFIQNQERIYKLELDKTGLTAIPQVIFTLKNLSILSLESNKLFAIDIDEPLEISKLKFLSLDENPLKKYPRDLFIQLCKKNHIHGRYKTKLNFRSFGKIGTLYPHINNSWQYFLTDRSEWKFTQFQKDAERTLKQVQHLNDKYLKPHKNDLLSRITQLGASEAVAIQEWIHLTDSADMKSLSEKIKPVYVLYSIVLSDVATCLIALEFLSELMSSVNENNHKPVWKNLFEAVEKFIDVFILLQDRLVDVEVMKDLIKKYKSIISMIEDPSCFDVDIPNKKAMLENKNKWLEEQSRHLNDLEQSSKILGELDSSSLNIAKLFLDRSEEDYAIIRKNVNLIGFYIKEIFKIKN